MFKDFIKTLKNHKRVAVFSHIRPDGDCVGAQVALSKWLTDQGYDVTAYNDDDVSDNMEWLTEIVTINKPTEEQYRQADIVILVDGNATHRFGEMKEWQDTYQKPIMIVDHHPEPEDGFDCLVSVPSASSTCELIYKLYEETGIDKIDENTAKALYTGIITDTGSLQFDSVTPETVEIVADLLRRGDFKPDEVINKIYSNKTINQFQLLGMALNTISLHEDNQFAVMHVTKEMMSATGTTNSDTEGFVNYPLSIKGVKIAIIFKDLEEEGVKMSLRSRSDIDVNVWARELGGGGHKKAAGAWHKGPLKQAIADTLDIGKKQL